MRYSKSAITFASLTAVLWTAAIALLIGQLNDQVLRPFAVITAVIACTATVLWYLSRDTRPPIVVHADWNPDLASRTTLRSTPAYQRVVSIPVPVLSATGGDGDTTLGIRRRGGTQTMDEIPTTGDPAYDRAFTDISNGLIVAREDDPWED